MIINDTFLRSAVLLRIDESESKRRRLRGRTDNFFSKSLERISDRGDASLRTGSRLLCLLKSLVRQQCGVPRWTDLDFDAELAADFYVGIVNVAALVASF